jgi:hypothetical protein
MCPSRKRTKSPPRLEKLLRSCVANHAVIWAGTSTAPAFKRLRLGCQRRHRKLGARRSKFGCLTHCGGAATTFLVDDEHAERPPAEPVVGVARRSPACAVLMPMSLPNPRYGAGLWFEPTRAHGPKSVPCWTWSNKLR